jgi:hypothetical protein
VPQYTNLTTPRSISIHPPIFKARRALSPTTAPVSENALSPASTAASRRHFLTAAPPRVQQLVSSRRCLVLSVVVLCCLVLQRCSCLYWPGQYAVRCSCIDPVLYHHVDCTSRRPLVSLTTTTVHLRVDRPPVLSSARRASQHACIGLDLGEQETPRL